MLRGLKLLHLGGLALSLGSIFTFVIISALIEGGSLENIAFGRKIISVGTNVLAIPGMWLLAITGVLMGLKRYGLKQRFVHLKLLIMAVVLINGYFFVIPAVSTATRLAAQSLAQGQLLPAYKDMYLRESLAGTVNVILIVTAAVIGVWRVGARS